LVMAEERFDVSHVDALVKAFRAHQVDFLIFGKGAAIIMGYPATTLDVDLFLPKSPENGAKVVAALQYLGFALTESQIPEIVRGKDFVHLNGPFRLDLVHAPDGLPDYQTVKRRSITIDQYPLVSLRDIIASKEAAGRIKDQMDLQLLKSFQEIELTIEDYENAGGFKDALSLHADEAYKEIGRDPQRGEHYQRISQLLFRSLTRQTDEGMWVFQARSYSCATAKIACMS